MLSFEKDGRARRVLGRTVPFLVAGVLFFAIDYVVRATPGGQTKDLLGFAGTLTQNGNPLNSWPRRSPTQCSTPTQEWIDGLAHAATRRAH